MHFYNCRFLSKNGLFVEREGLLKINAEVSKPTLRVNHLCELFWPGYVANMSLSGSSTLHSSETGGVVRIPQSQVLAMKSKFLLSP